MASDGENQVDTDATVEGSDGDAPGKSEGVSLQEQPPPRERRSSATQSWDALGERGVEMPPVGGDSRDGTPVTAALQDGSNDRAPATVAASQDSRGFAAHAPLSSREGLDDEALGRSLSKTMQGSGYADVLPSPRDLFEERCTRKPLKAGKRTFEAPSDTQPSPDAEYIESVRKKIDRLQVETMHNMVRRVELPMGDATTTCRFLYLTNDQADSIPTSRMGRVREELGVPQPKLIIRLMPSRFGTLHWQVFPYYSGRFPAKRVPQMDFESQAKTDHQLLLFAKEVILPLAMSTSALIVGQDTCSLTAAFLKVSSSIQNHLRGRCPFRLVIFARAFFFECQSRNAGSVSSHFKEASRSWKTREAAFDPALAARYGDDRAFWPYADLVVGRYSLVLFECLSHSSRFSEQTPINFENSFLSALSGVPTISLQTFGTDQMMMMPSIAEHVMRGTPFMLIDSRPRERIPKDVSEAEKDLRGFSEKLHAAEDGGVADWFTTDALAFVKGSLNRWRVGGLRPKTEAGQEVPAMWIWEAIETNLRREARNSRAKARRGEAQRVATPVKVVKVRSPGETSVEDIDQRNTTCEPDADGAGGDDEDADDEERQVIKGADLLMSYCGRELQWEMEKRHKRFWEGYDKIKNANSWKDLKWELDQNWLAIRGCTFHFTKRLDNFVRNHDWAWVSDNGSRPCSDWMKGQGHLFVDEDDVPVGRDDQYFQSEKQALLDMFEAEFNISAGLDRQKLTEKAFVRREETWLALYDILKAENVHASSLHDLHDCRRRLLQIAKIDYLPSENSLQGLVLLRRAWTLHDVFSTQAYFYKWVAKGAFIFALALGFATIAIVTSAAVAEDVPELDQEAASEAERNLLLATSLSGSFVAGFTALIEPSRKWIALRGAALSIKSEIWKFRSRMSDYKIDAAGDVFLGAEQEERKAEESFEHVLSYIQEKVQQGSGLSRTSFYSVATTSADTMVELFIRRDDEQTLGVRGRAGGHGELDNKDGGSEAIAIDASGAFHPVVATVKREVPLPPPQPIANRLAAKCSQAYRMMKGPEAPHLRKRKYIQHGQFKLGGRRPLQGEDDHHSPVDADGYIVFRLIPLRDYYQRKIPSCARRYRFFQCFILAGTVLSAFVAATFDPEPTAIIASLIGIVAAWQEFTGAERKLDRYSNAASVLENVLLWWQALPEEEKKIMRNIEALVESVETAVNSESAAWFKDAALTKAGSGKGKVSGGRGAVDESHEHSGDATNGGALGASTRRR